MSFLSKFQKNLFKNMNQVPFPSNNWSSVLLPRTHYDYQRSVGDGRNSSLLVASVSWVNRQLTEAPIKIWEQRRDESRKPVYSSKVYDLFDKPNPHYYGIDMMMAVGTDLYFTGNAYLIKRRNSIGEVVQLWWAPSTTIEPVWPKEPTAAQIQSGQDFIRGYEYRPDPSLKAKEYPPEDIMHFRWGLDSSNPRKGLAPLMSLMREVFTDEEASNFTSSLLKNMGVPGVILTPADNETTEPMSDEEVEATKRDFMQKFSGDRRGEPMVMDTKLDVHLISFSPEQLDLRKLRQIPEERVASVSGVAAVVLGFGAGLETSSGSYNEMLESSYQTTIMHLHRLMIPVIKHKLLAEFVPESKLKNYVIEFDITNVQIMQEVMNRKAKRYGLGVLYGWMERAEARQEFGLPVRDFDHVYLMRKGTYEVKEHEAIGPVMSNAMLGPEPKVSEQDPAEGGTSEGPAENPEGDVGDTVTMSLNGNHREKVLSNGRHD